MSIIAKVRCTLETSVCKANETLGIDEVTLKVTLHKPDVLVSLCRSCILPGGSSLHLRQFSASMWTADEAKEIYSLAKSIVPDIKYHAIPTGLQVERGPDAIVEYLVEKVPPLLDS